MKRSLPLLLCVVCIVFASCKKDDSDKAKAIYSPWFTPASYTSQTIFGILNFSYNQPAPEITQEVIDGGAVLVFGKMLGYVVTIWPANQVSQMPITLVYRSGSTTVTDTWTANITPGNLEINMVNDNNLYNSITTAHQFRYVVIPVGELAGRSAPLSYAEICAKYNIPE